MSALHMSSILDVDNLNRCVEDGRIRSCVDDKGRTLFNYTPQTQYLNAWDNETLMCRGLVVDEGGFVLTRPLRKFFNLDQHGTESIPPLPAEPFDIYEKVDGSMIAASTTPSGEMLITTRGSFQSDQAVAATDLWNRRFKDVQVPEGETWVFEYVAPWNRIVVQFDEEDLVLLACLSNETGLDCREIEDASWPGTLARRFDGMDLQAIRDTLPNLSYDEEGYVIRLKSGIRVKAKGNAYVELHRIVTNLSTRSVWEALSTGTFDSLLEVVPDEFHPWVRNVECELWTSFDIIANIAAHDLEDARLYTGNFVDYTRAQLAKQITQRASYPGLCFALEDGKDIAPRIWQMIKPERSMAMIVDEEV